MVSGSAIVAFVIGLLLLYIIFKILSLPFKLLWKVIINSLIGAIMLYVVKLVGIPVTINFLCAFIAGVFGLPGVVAVVIYTLM